MIFGEAGTGKTTTVKYVSNELREQLSRKKSSDTCSLLYLNSEVFDTQYRIFAYLARKFNKRVPMTGRPTDMVYSKFKNRVDAEDRCVIVILDAGDKLANNGYEALYNLSQINGELTNARVSLIGISNDLAFTDLLDPRVKSSLGEEEIIFPPYSAEQLKDILYERAKRAFYDAVLDDTVIPLCAALAASEHGDARRALDLLRISGEIAEFSGSKKVFEEHVRLASEKLEIYRVAEMVKTLPLHSKLVLSSVLVLSRERN